MTGIAKPDFKIGETILFNIGTNGGGIGVVQGASFNPQTGWVYNVSGYSLDSNQLTAVQEKDVVTTPRSKDQSRIV